jgi:hypothetical protein
VRQQAERCGAPGGVASAQGVQYDNPWRCHVIAVAIVLRVRYSLGSLRWRHHRVWARRFHQRGHQAWALWLPGESPARQAFPEVEPVAGHYRQALAMAEALGMRPLQTHCRLGLGTFGQQR